MMPIIRNVLNVLVAIWTDSLHSPSLYYYYYCVETIRINVLPRLLYLFQMLPIEVPKSTFDTLDKLISQFIWQRKRPRIRLKTQQLSKPDGGLKLPNLRHYYWAAQMKPLVAWVQNCTYTRWLNIEQSMCPKPLHILPFSDAPIKEMGQWTAATLKIWKKYNQHLGYPKIFHR